jgi:hypothetical protein
VRGKESGDEAMNGMTLSIAYCVFIRFNMFLELSITMCGSTFRSL